MNNDQVLELYLAALELPLAERAAFLAQACGADEALRREVEALLARAKTNDSFLAAPALPGVAALAGAEIGHYRVQASLGAGGMGEVYLAHDAHLNRLVALKILPRDFSLQPERVRRFKQEAQTVSQLNHPNIVTIHETGEHAGQQFIVTEYIAGQTLRERLRAAALSVPQTVDIAVQIAEALCAAHAAGIIHRDIKPENVMIRAGDGLVKVLDFGIAKLNKDEGGWMKDEAGQAPVHPSSFIPHPSLTTAGMIVGTASYMAPEQARGQDVDARADLFSFGVVLYEMLTGQRLLEGRTRAAVLQPLLDDDELPSLAGKLNDVPKPLAEIVRRALRKRREERYDVAEALLADLRRVQERLKSQRLRRWLQTSALAAVTAFVLVAAAVWLARGEVWEERILRDGHTAAVRRAVFSPDGRLLVSVGEDNRVIVWDFARRERLKTLTDHTGWVSSVAFSPDGKWFATGSFDQTVIVWDAARLEKAAVLRAHREPVHAVGFSPDGRWLITASAKPDERTIVWQVGRWEKARELPVGSGYGNWPFHPNGRWLLMFNDYGMQMRDVLTGRQVITTYRLPDFTWNSAAISPATSVMATTSQNGDVTFFDLSKHKLLGHHHAHHDIGRSVAYSPDGHLLASAADDILLWDAATQTKLCRFEYSAIVWSVAFSPDGRWLVSTHGDGAILLWDVAERRCVASFNEHSQPVRAVAFSPDGKRIASAGEDAAVLVWDVASGQRAAVLLGHQTRVNGASFAPLGNWPDGSQLVTYDQAGTINFWNITQRRVNRTIDKRGDGYALAVSPDQHWLVTTRDIYDTVNGQLCDLQGQVSRNQCYGLAFTRDGAQLAGVTVPGQVLLWDTRSWRLLAQQERKDKAFISVSFAPDGKQLVIGDDDGVVQLWSVEPLREVTVLGHHAARIKSVAFAPDGQTVASAGDDKKIKLWDVSWRRHLPRFFRHHAEIGTHTAPVLALAFAPDGNQLVSGEHDKSVRLYTRRRTLFGWRLD